MTAEPKPVISKRVLISATVALWLVVCLAYEMYRIAAFMALPPSGDLYAHDWSFRLFAFAFFRFPIWLVGLFAILAVEFTKARGPADMKTIDRSFSVLPLRSSNHAMERTPTRRALALPIALTFSLRSTRALGGRRSSCSR